MQSIPQTYYHKKNVHDYSFPKGRFKSFVARERRIFGEREKRPWKAWAGKHNCPFFLSCPSSYFYRAFYSMVGELTNTGRAASYCGHSFLGWGLFFAVQFGIFGPFLRWGAFSGGEKADERVVASYLAATPPLPTPTYFPGDTARGYSITGVPIKRHAC